MIIPFPAKTYVMITSQMVMETKRVTCEGMERVRHDPPLLTFFVDYEDSEGSCNVWDGESYAGALAAARDWAADGIAVRDQVGEVQTSPRGSNIAPSHIEVVETTSTNEEAAARHTAGGAPKPSACLGIEGEVTTTPSIPAAPPERGAE